MPDIKFEVELAVTESGYGRWVYEKYSIVQYAYIIANDTTERLKHFIVYFDSMRTHQDTILSLEAAKKQAAAHFILNN